MINPERYRQIDELFQAALEVEPAERAAFIVSACGGDESLRQEVEALLASAEQEWKLIDEPVPEISALFLPERPPELEIGERLGHYHILSLLGTGGMGQVYLAEDSRLGRKVALKLLPREFTENELRLRRFQHEARAASSLNHPSILTIHDIAEIDGRRLIATEFIDGETLRQRIQRGELNTDEVLDIAVQVASALAAAHQAGIIHRDIKPENIMLRHDGLVKVLDFGLAKLGEHETPVEHLEVPAFSRGETGAGLLMGTLPYMSPEQIRGEPVNARSDIFSLGVVIYEMITGHAPFLGESNTDLIASILEYDPPPLLGLSTAVLPELQRIVDKALIKNQEDRYPNVQDLFGDLRRLQELSTRSKIEHSAEANVPVARVSGHTKVYFPRVLLPAALIVALAATYILIKSVARLHRPSQNMRLAVLPGGEKSVGAAISHNGKYLVQVIQDAGQQSLWVRNLAANTKTRVAAPAGGVYRGPAFSPDDNYIYYVRTDDKPATLYRIPTIGGDSEKVLRGVGTSITFSPDGNRLAFVRDMGKGRTALVRSSLDGSEERTLAERLMPAFFSGSLAWSPDGNVIVCCAGVGAGGRYTNVVEVRAEGGPEREICSQHWNDLTQVTWLPDGAGLILSAMEKDHNASQIWRLSYPSGELRKITNDLDDYGPISLTADSRSLVTTRFERRTNFWVAPNGDSSKAVPITTGKRDYYRFVSWTLDDKLVYPSDASGHRDIWIMEADGTGQKQLTVDAGNNLQSSVSPDGRYIVFSSNRPRVATYNVWRMEIDGGNPLRLTHGAGEVQPRCSPDGKWVIYTSGGPEGDITERTIWKIPVDGGEPVQLTNKPSNWPDVSPDGKLVACWYKDDPGSAWQIAILPVEGGQPAKLFKVPSNPGHAIRWTPDGKAVSFIVTRDEISNIWSQALAGDAPKQLTDFRSEEIICFDWSRDGRLVCSRLSIARDLVLIRDFL
ncbi:MAG TPA: LpqB family beta-propeller domain-containing protein [Blastocatellia bacterium]|nr:LpqB family beta-propeller domain-containing protein [Blastocatellia bacterium]